jgi:alkylation response protein AidB-like acyl-CoA dehydrogenase
MVSCYCLTEPGAGSDANSGKQQKLFYLKMENHIPSQVKKMWISNAGFCSVFIVFARIR